MEVDAVRATQAMAEERVEGKGLAELPLPLLCHYRLMNFVLQLLKQRSNVFAFPSNNL